MLYRITDGSVSAGGRQILAHFDFEIKGKEKIALVGRNGAGKTTLLRLLAGELSLDRDDRRRGLGIYRSERLTVGMLHQHGDGDPDQTVEDLLLAACPANDRYSRERFAYETEYDRLFTGFGFAKAEKKKPLSAFSGGERTKISLIRLLLQKPDLLLLDEPTNHLDLPTTVWLEDYFKTYEKAVIFVSHDRYFLDQVAEATCEIRGGKVWRYAGNYTQFRAERRREIVSGLKAYERQQQEIRRLRGLIERFKHKPNKAAFARSRKKILERMERIEKPDIGEAHLFTGNLTPEIPGNKWTAICEDLTVGYDRPLYTLSLKLRKGQRLGVLGGNGVGKSAFLKTIAGEISPLAGSCTLGSRTTCGYFDQRSADFHSEKTAVEHFRERFPSLSDKEIRKILGAYLLRGETAHTRIDRLSGGERARLALAELLECRPNFLILDEPTNHMDIPAKETLESAFAAYEGTILFVSHDRYFLQRVADSLLVLDGTSAGYYPFGYAHYVEKRKDAAAGTAPASLVQAKDQALIAGLRAVPKKERPMLREQGTEEAYREWRLRLADEPLQLAKTRVERLWESWNAWREAKEQAAWRRWIAEQYGDAADPARRDAVDFPCQNTAGAACWDAAADFADPKLEKELANELETAWDAWTDACLAWYDVWNDPYHFTDGME